MFWLSLLPMAAGLLLFVCIMLAEPRSLWSGISCFIFLGGSALTILVWIMLLYDNYLREYQWAMMILVAAALLVTVIILFFPLSMIVFFFTEGIRNIRREGLRLSNMLSLLFACLLALFLFVWPIGGPLIHKAPKIIQIVYWLITLAGNYFLILLIVFCFSAFLNLLHPIQPKRLDEIVVLGSGLNGDKVTPLLAARIDAGLKLLERNPKAKLILSGGKGSDEKAAEGAAMYLYCVDHGADPDRLIAETRSVNTRENLTFSSRLFHPKSKRIAIVTTRYHVFRALLLAKELGIRCKGYGSKTKWYFTLNALLREFIGYLSMTWKRQLLILSIPAFFVVLFGLLS